MVAQLLNFNTNANGNRYTDVDREAAYQCWKIAAGRSLRKTAELLSISASTLGTWSQNYGWVRRAETEDAEAVESMKLSIKAQVVGVVDDVVTMFKEIAADKTASRRDRMEAGKWLAGIAGVAPVIKSETAFIDQVAARDQVDDTPDFASMNTQQLREYEMSIRRYKHPL